jgi:peptidoglycan-associated lipoprotein
LHDNEKQIQTAYNAFVINLLSDLERCMKFAHVLYPGRLAATVFQVLLLTALVGCGSPKLAETPTPTTTPTPVPTAVAPLIPLKTSADVNKPTVTAAVQPVTVHPLDDLKSPLANRTVYFEFDSTHIAESSIQLLEQHAKYMRLHGTARVRLEGNADERGGREYNLALGQKRSEAVASALKLLGVTSAQMEPVSFGKEKPVAFGHDEASWAKNRKVDIVYTTR